MNKFPLRRVLSYSILGLGFILIDLLIDRLLGGAPTINPPHIVFTIVVVVISFWFMNRSLRERYRAEAILRQSRDEMEIRVNERTAELQRSNQALEAEIVEHQKAESQRKAMERSLRDSEERYRSLFDHFPEPVTVWDENGVLRLQNLVSARNLGGKRENFIGQSAQEIFGAAGAIYQERMARVLQSGLPENQEDAIDLHFGKRYFWTSIQRITNSDGEYSLQVISYDITDRKRTEKFLRASEEKFSTVFHYSPDAIAIIRLSDGVFLDVNDAFSKHFGYPFAEVVGKSWQEIRLWAGVDDSTIAGLFHHTGMVADYELNFQTLLGEKATMLLSLIPITVSQDACVLAIGHDITEHKRAEEKLRAIQAELAVGVQQRIMLEERHRLSRELHDSVSQAIYGISLGAHTALTLFDSNRPKVLEAIHYILSLAQAAMTEMRALIFELRPESLELEGLAAALNKQTAALRARYEVNVELELCDGEPRAPLAVKEALYRIAQEALHNAIKHGQPEHLKVRLCQHDDHLELSVSDDGIGFNTRTVFPGHLGLRSMQERAAGVQGVLEITSEPGHGTLVHVCIPSAQPETMVEAL